MALEPGNENKKESFEEFFEKWNEEQSCQLDDLVYASKESQQSSQTNSLPCLVNRVIAHYEKYYSIKAEWAKANIVLLLSPPWSSLLEDAFTWIGGWRPSTAIHLLYAKSSIQFEANLSDLLSGKEIGNLGDLSGEQIDMIDKLQRSTIAREREITEKFAKQQAKVADMEMVELSHKVCELTRAGGEINEGDRGRINSALKSKEEGFVMILQRADDLRLETLKGAVGILSAIQAVHFLVAATELLRKMHDWGKQKENEATTQAV